MEKNKGSKGGIIALLLILFLLCAGAGIYRYLNKDKSDNRETNNPVENIEEEQEKEENSIIDDNKEELTNKYEQINSFNNNGVFEHLSFLLDGTIGHRRVNNRNEIKDAININGNILDIDEYEAEFAFQYGFLKKYANYLGEKYTKETGAFSLTKNDYEKIYEKVYGKECSLDNKFFSDKCYGDYLELEEDNTCLKDKSIKYYNSGIFSGYDDEYRFVEIKSEKNDEIIKTTANIYNPAGDCYEELELSDEDYCTNHARKIGRIELEYKIDKNNNYIFKAISLFEK